MDASWEQSTLQSNMENQSVCSNKTEGKKKLMKILLRSLLLCINTAIFWLSDITVTQAPPISMTSVHQQSCETITNMVLCGIKYPRRFLHFRSDFNIQ